MWSLNLQWSTIQDPEFRLHRITSHHLFKYQMCGFYVWNGVRLVWISKELNSSNISQTEPQKFKSKLITKITSLLSMSLVIYTHKSCLRHFHQFFEMSYYFSWSGKRAFHFNQKITLGRLIKSHLPESSFYQRRDLCPPAFCFNSKRKTQKVWPGDSINLLRSSLENALRGITNKKINQ